MTAPPSDQPRPQPESAAKRSRQRLRSYSTKNMVYSMLAVLALVFVVWAIQPADSEQLQRQPVEVVSPARYAQEQSGWPLWVAGELEQGWTATYARYSAVAQVRSWRVGWSTPEGEHAALDQTGASGSALAGWQRALVGEDATQVGRREIDGPEGTASWQVWQGSGATSLVLPPAQPGAGQQVTTVVHGTAELAELTRLAESLQPLPE
ncbi:DUF4245 domain-containing protein [Ornithinicoccus halotolerans]|uniref:DUF4245 domain-containing protein n=1 Tax=Ornithinicoccus halotolerans TaxID=1748220 RepID=UPI001886284C|nr:DUF4245 domain-containing protein [Ornithinicoccus halotolerans]